MSYQNVEYALAATIRQIENLTASNVALGGSNALLLSQRRECALIDRERGSQA